MSFMHVGFVVLKYSSKYLLEIALEQYARHLIKTNKGYLAYQVDALCDNGKEVSDSYAARTQGYYDLQQVAEKIAAGKSDVSKNIVKFTVSLHENIDEDDYVVLEINKEIA